MPNTKNKKKSIGNKYTKSDAVLNSNSHAEQLDWTKEPDPIKAKFNEEVEKVIEADEDLKQAKEEYIKQNFWSYFKKNKKQLHFLKELEYLYDLFTKNTLNTKDKAILIACLFYFINPFDLIIDITPILGFTDDFGFIFLTYRYFTNRAIEEKEK